MRILVISDSHRRGNIVERIIEAQPEAKDIFFLGDMVSDIEDFKYLYTDRRFYIVSGNCDGFSSFPAVDLATVGGKKILFTHGHTFGVKRGTAALEVEARRLGAHIALYGHTHTSNIYYSDGLYIVNPGSCSCSRNGPDSYAVIDIEPNGIMPVIINI